MKKRSLYYGNDYFVFVGHLILVLETDPPTVYTNKKNKLFMSYM